MSSFFRSNKSASSSSTDLAKAGPETSEIYTTPLDGVKPSKKWEYDENQIKQINELKEYTATLLLPKSDPYHPWEARFLADPGTHPRYMRASKWNISNAKTRIKSTIEWRREYQPELIKQTDVAVEAETGKIILTGFDQDARPVMYLRPGRENTETSPRQIRHLIFHLERAIDLMPPGQEQIAIIVDYKSATASSTPSIGTGRKVLSILQNHYVERLGRGLVVNMPWWMNAFFSGIMPLMDPITRDKIRFNPKLPELVPSSQLDHEFGGEYNLKFDHGVYWKSIVDFCHLADDGGRVDKDGKSWYPPSGNGIKAAVDGYAPRKGSVVTGDLAKIGSPDALPIDPSEAVTIPAGPKALEGVSNSDNTTNEKAETNGAVTGGVGAVGEKPSDATDELVGSTKRLSLGERAKSTAPGAPEGTAVFDHKPTEEEIETAQAVEVKS